MTKPIVAIVGRPNVGKSTLVNRICQRRDAIVHESFGVTRDRSYHEADWCGHEFELIDTGGIEAARSKDQFAPRIREQAVLACDEADVLVMVVDGSVGITGEDEEVARILRKSDKPVFLVVNKIDNPDDEKEIWDFYALGLGDPIAISASHGTNTGDLLDLIVAAFPEQEPEFTYPENALNVAIIGRPNVGKSSLTNRLCGKNRTIVSDVAGTTRDAIDITINQNGQVYRLVDTAGMRRKSVVHEDVEYYSQVRGLRAIDEADVCLLVIDATEGVTEQDQKIAGMAIDRGCAIVVLLNKWDLLKEEYDRETCMMSLAAKLNFAKWAPMLRISAKTGRGVSDVLSLASVAAAARATQIPTAKLNRCLAKIRESGHTVVDRGRRLKMNYVTQTGQKPPVFTFFCNNPDMADDNFKRFVENRIRDDFNLLGTPIRLRFKSKETK